VTVLRALTQALTTIAPCFQRAGGSLEGQQEPPVVAAMSRTDPARGEGDEPSSTQIPLAVSAHPRMAAVQRLVNSWALASHLVSHRFWPSWARGKTSQRHDRQLGLRNHREQCQPDGMGGRFSTS